MLISALCDYYDILEKEGKSQRKGYSVANITYLIELNSNGTLKDIIDCRVPDSSNAKGKPKPVEMILPKRTEKTTIDSNVIEHRGEYIFGVSYDNKKKILKANNLVKFEAFKKKNLDFFETIHSELTDAYKNFLLNWNPEVECNNESLVRVAKDINTQRFAFCLSGRPDLLLHEDPLVIEGWEKYYSNNENAEDSVYSQCAILGTNEPIARIHNKIKGLGAATGNILVGFKEEAFLSYGMTQSYNSNVSEKAMEKYTEALNYLVANRLHRTYLDEVTILHWSEDDNEQCDDIFNMLTFGEEKEGQDTDQLLADLMKNISKGYTNISQDVLGESIGEDTLYYIVGLKPNSSRVSLKFIYRQKFGKLLENVCQHIMDMCLYPNMKPVPLWRINKELVSPKSSNDKTDPSLNSKLMQAILMGTSYPTTLLATMIRRVRIDSDTENNKYIKINDTRMGVIKACINRNCRLANKEEEIKMALDKENNNPAYVCGRLFAVLENIQQKAANYSLNRTIRDAYFASASVRPATVFPKLISLSQHHLSKLDDRFFRDQEIQELLEKIGAEFPKTLSLTEQGVFMLGYYQQKADTTNRIKEYKENK